jgi:putative peptidoglycan lipid II flippase
MEPDRAPQERPDSGDSPGGSPLRFGAGLFTVAASTLASRVLGMLRDTVTARLFGVSPVTDAFWLAFKIPNLARRLFGEGALTAAFLPAFTRVLPRGNEPVSTSAWQLASTVFSLLAGVLATLVLAGEALLWGVARWSDPDSATRLLLGLTAVMLPYALLICLAAQVTAVLHALGHFTWPALVPVALNLCWISSVWLVDPWFEPDREMQAYALALCVVASGGLQLGMQWPMLRRFGFRFVPAAKETRVAALSIFRAMLPVMFGLSIEQINTLLDGLIAWSFSEPAGGGTMPLPGSPAYPLRAGAVSALYFGERLYQFPVGVFGVALGTVLFPLFARHAARGEIERLRDDLSLGLRLVVAIGIPASAGLAIVSTPLTRLLLEHGEFTAEDSLRTSALVAAYAAGVWAFCAMPLLYRGFYALGDRATPVRIGTAAVAGDLLLNLTLIWPFAERGLAWSTAFSASAQVAALVWMLQRQVGRIDWRGLRGTACRAALATAAMTAACLLARWGLPGGDTLWQQGVALAGQLGAGAVTYFVTAHALGMNEPWWLLSRHVPEPASVADADSPPL